MPLANSLTHDRVEYILRAAFDDMFVRLTSSRRRQRPEQSADACGLPLNESLATVCDIIRSGERLDCLACQEN